MGLSYPAFPIGGITVHTFSTGAYRQNCYVIRESKSDELIVIDPGGEAGFLIAQIEAIGGKVREILLTHGHFDHLGAVDPLMKHFGVRCFAHILERRLVRQSSIYAYRFARERLLPPQNIEYFEDCNELSWSGGGITVVHTPGHTAGCVTYLFEDGAAFVGDTLFHSAVGPTNYPESDPTALHESVAALIQVLPAGSVIFPGHGRYWAAADAAAWWIREAANPAQYQLFGDQPS